MIWLLSHKASHNKYIQLASTERMPNWTRSKPIDYMNICWMLLLPSIFAMTPILMKDLSLFTLFSAHVFGTHITLGNLLRGPVDLQGLCGNDFVFFC